MPLALVTPVAEHLPSYVDALERGWTPDNTAGGEATRLRFLERIAEDADAFLASMDDREANGPDIVLPDGTAVKRLPGFNRWMWDDGFVGAIGLRWSPGTEELPSHVLGHIGYAVVPWARRQGHATAALRALLPQAAETGLRWIELTTDPENLASQKVIIANGGRLLGRFTKPAAYGGAEGLRWRIDL